ncbi:MAG: OsmC family protein [Deltaproteobacteria bacterium]|nr:OsmC family protein [Deltaproteobacteria bacterium]
MQEMLQVRFPGGKRVDTQIKDMLIQTDQPVDEGGEGSAPQPFQLFLASIAACAGVYAINFCQARDLSMDGMTLSMSGEFDEKKKLYKKFALHLTLPEGFPEKYRKSILRVMDLCFVKKHIVDPPEFELTAG